MIADLKQEPTEETGGWSVSLTELFLQHNHRENYVLELKAELPEAAYHLVVGQDLP